MGDICFTVHYPVLNLSPPQPCLSKEFPHTFPGDVEIKRQENLVEQSSLVLCQVARSKLQKIHSHPSTTSADIDISITSESERAFSFLSFFFTFASYLWGWRGKCRECHHSPPFFFFFFDVTGRWATGSRVARRSCRFYWPWSMSGSHNEEVLPSPSTGSNGRLKGLDCSCRRTLLYLAAWLLNSFNHLSGSYSTCHPLGPFL